MKLLSALLLILIALPISAQTLTPIFDSPDQVGAICVGGSTPTPIHPSGCIAYGKKIIEGLYSYTRIDFNVAKNLTFTTATTTGVKQILAQFGRFTFAVDGTLGVASGASSPSNGQPSAQLAYSGNGGLFIRLNKDIDDSKGLTKNWYFFADGGVVGTTSGNGITARFGFARTIN